MKKEYLLRLPWPDKRLSANARNHWAKRANATKEARRLAAWTGLAQGVMPNADAVLEFSFYPPDRRKRDTHNLPHMMKPYIDGVADAMGVDDHRFRCIFPSTLEDPIKGGAVLVHVRGNIGGGE